MTPSGGSPMQGGLCDMWMAVITPEITCAYRVLLVTQFLREVSIFFGSQRSLFILRGPRVTQVCDLGVFPFIHTHTHALSQNHTHTHKYI